MKCKIYNSEIKNAIEEISSRVETSRVQIRELKEQIVETSQKQARKNKVIENKS